MIPSGFFRMNISLSTTELKILNEKRIDPVYSTSLDQLNLSQEKTYALL